MTPSTQCWRAAAWRALAMAVQAKAAEPVQAHHHHHEMKQ
jgi:hypothetical protein